MSNLFIYNSEPLCKSQQSQNVLGTAMDRRRPALGSKLREREGRGGHHWADAWLRPSSMKDDHDHGSPEDAAAKLVVAAAVCLLMPALLSGRLAASAA